MNIAKRVNIDEFVKNISAILAGLADRNEVVIVETKDRVFKVEPLEQTSTTPKTRLTDEEVSRGLSALRKARQLTAQMSKSRGGEPFAESWEDIRKDREERSKQWL
jgi:hypothetical protein